jgi:magnesium transporter
MVRLIKKTSKKLGTKPGTVVYVGEKRTEPVYIDVIDFTKTDLNEKRVDAPDDCRPYKDSPTITWIDVDGIHQSKLVESLGQQFDLHPLVLEDIVNAGHRPKIEEDDNHVFIILKMLYLNGDNELVVEQVSVLFGKNWVITFQETGEDVFGHVRERIRKTVPRVRFMSADYLAYALMDAVVDNYFVVLEHLGEQIENLEDQLAEQTDQDSLHTIRTLKRQLLLTRKAIWPLREVIGGLTHSESKLIKKSTQPFIRDLYEHTVQVIDTVETFRDMVSGLLDLYHTGVSNRMNEVMKVLTIFASVFIPLGFLAGVYGMNFDTGASPFNLPELGFRYGYPLFWLIAAGVAGGLLWFFRRKGWL